MGKLLCIPRVFDFELHDFASGPWIPVTCIARVSADIACFRVLTRVRRVAAGTPSLCHSDGKENISTGGQRTYECLGRRPESSYIP